MVKGILKLTYDLCNILQNLRICGGMPGEVENAVNGPAVSRQQLIQTET